MEPITGIGERLAAAIDRLAGGVGLRGAVAAAECAVRGCPGVDVAERRAHDRIKSNQSTARRRIPAGVCSGQADLQMGADLDAGSPERVPCASLHCTSRQSIDAVPCVDPIPPPFIFCF